MHFYQKFVVKGVALCKKMKDIFHKNVFHLVSSVCQTMFIYLYKIKVSFFCQTSTASTPCADCSLFELNQVCCYAL